MKVNTMKKEDLIKTIIDLELECCQDDTSYNDNTIHDLLMYGSKGLKNMSVKELREHLTKVLEWTSEDDEMEA